MALGGRAQDRGWWSVSSIGLRLQWPRFLRCARGAVQAGGPPGEELARMRVHATWEPGDRGREGTPSHPSALSRQAGARRPLFGLRPSPRPGSRPDHFPPPLSQLSPPLR